MMTKVVSWLPEQSQHSTFCFKSSSFIALFFSASSCKAQLAVTAGIYKSANDPTAASVPMETELRLSEQDKVFLNNRGFLIDKQAVTFAIQLDNSLYNEQFYRNLSNVASKATKIG